MQMLTRLSVTAFLVLSTGVCLAQSDEDAEELKIAALEALISAPSERAYPMVARVLQDPDNSDEVKERALFVLSQIDLPEAQALILETARTSDGELREEAIQMIGIGGDPDAMAGLAELYQAGDDDVREAVLEAYMIAGDIDAIYRAALNAQNPDDFEAAVEILAAMGAKDHLRELRATRGSSESLIEAYAISGDFETLREIATDSSDIEQQAQAIEALGIIGGDEVNDALVEIYRGSDSEYIREAALDGMLIAGHDQGVLALYRSSSNASEKRQLLEYLVMMDSEAMWEVIDEALEGNP